MASTELDHFWQHTLTDLAASGLSALRGRILPGTYPQLLAQGAIEIEHVLCFVSANESTPVL